MGEGEAEAPFLGMDIVRQAHALPVLYVGLDNGCVQECRQLVHDTSCA